MFKQLLKRLKKLKRQLLYYNSYLSAKSSIAVFRASKMTYLIKKNACPETQSPEVEGKNQFHKVIWHTGTMACVPHHLISPSLLLPTHTKLKNIYSSPLGQIQNLSNTLKFNVKTRAENLIISFNPVYYCLHPVFSNDERTIILVPSRQ